MRITVARVLSLLIGVAYAVAIVVSAVAHSKSAAQAAIVSCEDCVIVFIPLALIWFPEQIGAATGYIGHGEIAAESPPMLVSIMGWIFLVGLPVVAYFFAG